MTFDSPDGRTYSDPLSDETVTLRLDDIVPYWRNPRLITDESVNAVAASLRRFGYQQPIVVDASNVIVMGHTRYAAMRRLGVTECEVRRALSLTQAQARKLRILDNRLHEYARWDFDGLVAELDELDAAVMRSYFPEVITELAGGPDIEALAPSPLGTPTDGQSSQVAFTCPSCFHEWEREVTREAVLSGRIEAL